MKRAGVIAVGLVLLVLLIFTVAIAFGTATPPPPITSLAAPMAKIDFHDLPPLAHYRARDGADLGYRAYPAAGERIAILVHGAMGESSFMHEAAKALRAAGVTAYSLDLRGHAGEGRAGDIDYVGQLDDDLADFVAFLRPRHAGARFFLVGHSAGGGFALRIAEGRYGGLFQRYVLLSPALYHDAPTYRPRAGGMASPYLPRLIALTILDRFGMHRFEGLPVIAFAAPRDVPIVLTPVYSYRLQTNLAAPSTYLADLAKVEKPMSVIIGAADEIFIADRYAPLLQPVKPDLAITILPGIGHTGTLVEPAALAAVVAVLAPAAH